MKLLLRSRLLAVTFLLVVLAVLIPFEDSAHRISDRILTLEAVVLLLICAIGFGRTGFSASAEVGRLRLRGLRVKEIAFLFVLMTIWMCYWRDVWISPALVLDDIELFEQSRSLHSMFSHLFVPHNEHFLVPTRVLTWLLCFLSPPEHYAEAAVAGRLILFVWACVLFYLALVRETDSAQTAAFGLIVFTITPAYREVIQWYAAVQWTWTVIFLCLTLLAVQRALSSTNANTRRMWATLAALYSAFGPLCSWSGVIIGPAVSLYIWSYRKRISRGWVLTVVPGLMTVSSTLILGMIARSFATSSLGYVGIRSLSISEIEMTIRFAARSVADHLVLDNLGLPSQLRDPPFVYPVLFAIFTGLVIIILARCGYRASLALGLAVILMGYAVVYPFRVRLGYYAFFDSTRYQLLPQFGLVWFLCTAVAERADEVGNDVEKMRAIRLIGFLGALWVWHEFGPGI